jgi:pseudouridylate synthase
VSLRIAPLVAAALAREDAVVALESTVLTHGLPRPQNLELASELEGIVRKAGAVPATVGVLQGELVVGLDEAELGYLAQAEADKASPWNLAALIASGKNAGTTVAATIHAAARAGIKVFATGGIGGVHRGESFDESADLKALAEAPMIVVCSGAKSILDVAATLERLESLGVAVIGYRSDYLAGFYSSKTRLPLPARADSPEEIARIYGVQQRLGLKGALLVSNPVSLGLDEVSVEGWLRQALGEAGGLKGKEVTPFLLSRLSELSGGRSLEVNLRLLKENSRLAAEIARALAKEGVRQQVVSDG